ncbi:MAG: tetratricopeptide repeat protein [Leptospirales bacterium]|nr:tetratricopeptide repeat protein [Leptospirales bacterium]
MIRPNAKDCWPVWASVLAATALLTCSGAGREALDARYGQALAAYAGGDQAKSKLLLEEILKEDSDYTPALLMQAKILYYAQNMDAAEEAFRAAQRSDSRNIDAMVGLARVLALKAEGRDEALALIQDAVGRSGASVEAWYVKGLVHERRGEVDQAIAAYRAAANEGRRLSLVHLQLGQLYRRAGLQEQSEYELKLAEALSLGDPAMRRQIDAARSSAAPSSGEAPQQPAPP